VSITQRVFLFVLMTSRLVQNELMEFINRECQVHKTLVSSEANVCTKEKILCMLSVINGVFAHFLTCVVQELELVRELLKK
jgi:hypothetical protein